MSEEANLSSRPKAPGRRGGKGARRRPKPSAGKGMKGVGDDDDAAKPDAAAKAKALAAHEAKKVTGPQHQSSTNSSRQSSDSSQGAWSGLKRMWSSSTSTSISVRMKQR